MKKWFDEEYEFTVEVTGFLRGDHTERYCRNGEEIGDTYTCTYGCPVNKDREAYLQIGIVLYKYGGLICKSGVSLCKRESGSTIYRYVQTSKTNHCVNNAF